jgi:hypothetical protein
MSRSAKRLLRLFGLLGAATALSLGTLPALAQSESTIDFSVDNPSPGDTLHVGGTIVQGMAFDSAAESGTGIEAIDVFLGNRDEGGIIIGHGTFDLTTITDNEGGGMVVGHTDESLDDVWNAQVSIPSRLTGVRTLWFYAHSAISGQEVAISIPVTIAP